MSSKHLKAAPLPRWLDMEDAVKQASTGGSIRREEWPLGEVLFIVKVRFEGRQMYLEAIHSKRDDFGNYQPTPEDSKAQDWVVVAKAVRR